VLVLSHLCHPQPSAYDNSSGVSATLEAARRAGRVHGAGTLGGLRREFGSVDARVHRHVRVVASRPADAPAVVSAVNLDMVGENQELSAAAS